MKGLYFHIPFCASKCRYCDFYSFKPKEKEMNDYLSAVLSCIEKYAEKVKGSFDTVYFGGGTPSFFGGERISAILKKSGECFSIDKDAEITVECNPSSVSDELMKQLSEAGVNRISMGVQSAIDDERIILGRISGKEQVEKAIRLAKENGIKNISLDLMLGIPNQTMKSLDESIDFIIKANITHVSAYILKLEEGTPLFKMQNELNLPDEDEVCEMYLHAVKRFGENGLLQYEVSNFALKGYESRHNTKYWLDGEYLGIGPSAHSFIDGKRFYFERSINDFINGKEPVFDDYGGDEEEFIMLRLRLSSGLSDEDYFEKYNKHLPEKLFEKAKWFEKEGLAKVEKTTIRLTAEGFLLSNAIIYELINQI